MSVELFGLSLNPWADAAIRLQIIVGFMTVVVMGLIYAERKVLARFHQRIGPQRTGPKGTLQSVADAVKLVGKEDLRPAAADPWTFELAPYFVFIPIFLGFVIVPWVQGWNVRILELGILYFVAISSISIVGWLMAGWGSDNRYAIIGALRAAAQGISYELPLVLALLSAAMIAGSFQLDRIVEFQDTVPILVWQPLGFFIFFVAALAELNRTPFDIPVGESEIVGGPFVEYSGIRWSMFFLAEYAGMLIMAFVGSSVFLGGYAWPFGEELGLPFQILISAAKGGLFIFLIFWVRASVPRLRIDQLMGYSWKVLLPFSFLQIMINGLVLVYDLPHVILLVTGVALLGALFWVTDGIARRPLQPRRKLARVLAVQESEG
ncbi:MAG: NADH-quinone oxidoreductase subunit NuoH [Chloroflexi bacterium]|jgi:NADH-quinone oxidoreductase subunit H|nr:NADH-quinone oxidoreductase subunit NuoH [Chloroflexota bacterium]|tara:strand:+ start:234 stop:1367 length:1134 start_codon:yes stop_codon:yes gene_type:complete